MGATFRRCQYEPYGHEFLIHGQRLHQVGMKILGFTSRARLVETVVGFKVKPG